jgi:uncharacterized delta-60 repeat protein
MSPFRAAFLTVALGLPAAALAQPGTIDPSFGGGPQLVTGGVWSPTPHGAGIFNLAVVQSTGKIVALGRCDNVPGEGFGAMRFNLDGSVDTTFGQAGSASQSYLRPTGGFNAPYIESGYGANSGALGPGGRIVVMDTVFQFACFTADGAPDTSFGTGGRLSMALFKNRYWRGGSLAIQPDGKIVAAGYSLKNLNGYYNVTIARLNPNGSLDTTFASTGHKATPGYLIDAQNDSWVVGTGCLALQPDGKILVASYSSTQAVMARYLPSGSLDTTFGVGGKRSFSFSGGRDFPRSLALTSDGRIILEASQGQTVYLARYTPSGSLDPTFGGYSSGWTSMALPAGGVANYTGIALQPDNSVLIPLSWPDGTLDSSGHPNPDQAVFRFTPSGLMDGSFGTWGSGLSQLAGWPGQYDEARGLTVDLSGRIILVGAHWGTTSDISTTGGPMVTAIRGQ